MCAYMFYVYCVLKIQIQNGFQGALHMKQLQRISITEFEEAIEIQSRMHNSRHDRYMLGTNN